MEAESENCHGREFLSFSRNSLNQPKRKRDMSTVYPIDEEELLLAAADKYLQDDSSGRDSPVSIMASDDSLRSSRSFSPGSPSLSPSPPASGSASPLPPLASASPAPSSSWRGSPWPSPTPSPSPPLSEPESAYFGDDSDTSRPRDGGDLTEDEGGRFSSGSTSSGSSGDVGEGGGDAPARRSRSRTVRSACFVASAIKAAPDGDDHNYSLASRCAASAASAAGGRRRNPWRAAREGGGGGGGGGGQRRWRRWAAPSPRPPRGALLG